MARKRRALVALGAVGALGVAALILVAPRHALVCQEIPVGEEVRLTSKGTPLAASFLKPKTATARLPGVVMIVGSGSSSYRCSWRPRAFPFWRSISEAFLAKGYAVLLLEKKGVNQSGGHWETQTFRDRVDDTMAGVRYLRNRPDIDSARVGICGHSQGGWIAQLAAADCPDEVAFVVNLSGPNVSVKRQIIDDQESKWRCAGISEDRIAAKARWLERWLDAYGTLSRLVKLDFLSRIINYDPETENVPARIRCPILAVYGEYDGLVIPETNMRLLQKRLATGGNTRSTIVIVPRGNHGFVQGTSRCPDKARTVPSMAAEFFRALATWDPFSS